jgi:hypothetical protein
MGLCEQASLSSDGKMGTTENGAKLPGTQLSHHGTMGTMGNRTELLCYHGNSVRFGAGRGKPFSPLHGTGRGAGLGKWPTAPPWMVWGPGRGTVRGLPFRPHSSGRCGTPLSLGAPFRAPPSYGGPSRAPLAFGGLSGAPFSSSLLGPLTPFYPPCPFRYQLCFPRRMFTSGLCSPQAYVHPRRMFTPGVCLHRAYIHPRRMFTRGLCSPPAYDSTGPLFTPAYVYKGAYFNPRRMFKYGVCLNTAYVYSRYMFTFRRTSKSVVCLLPLFLLFKMH